MRIIIQITMPDHATAEEKARNEAMVHDTKLVPALRGILSNFRHYKSTVDIITTAPE